MSLIIKNIGLSFYFSLILTISHASSILIPMDENSQINHLKAYGIAYWILQNEIEVEWLLNYRGGSFLINNYNSIQEECTIRGVSFEIISEGQVKLIRSEINNPEVNKEIIKLEKAPSIAVPDISPSP